MAVGGLTRPRCASIRAWSPLRPPGRRSIPARLPSEVGGGAPGSASMPVAWPFDRCPGACSEPRQPAVLAALATPSAASNSLPVRSTGAQARSAALRQPSAAHRRSDQGRIGPQPGLERPMLRPGGRRSRPSRGSSAPRAVPSGTRGTDLALLAARHFEALSGGPLPITPALSVASARCSLRQRPPEPPGVGAGAHRWRCNRCNEHGCSFLPAAW